MLITTERMSLLQNMSAILRLSARGDMPDMDFVEREGARVNAADVTENGWIGFTDKYWMTTLIPEPGQSFTAVAKHVTGADVFQTDIRLPVQAVAPGAVVDLDREREGGLAASLPWDSEAEVVTRIDSATGTRARPVQHPGGPRP